MQKIRKNKGWGQNIRDIRNSLHMTQEEVAAKLQVAGYDMSRSVYSQIECWTYNIRVEELIELKKLFKVDYNAFFEPLEKMEWAGQSLPLEGKIIKLKDGASVPEPPLCKGRCHAQHDGGVVT